MGKKKTAQNKESIQFTKSVARRDFVAGTLLGVGGSLLSASAPGTIQTVLEKPTPNYALLGAS